MATFINVSPMTCITTADTPFRLTRDPILRLGRCINSQYPSGLGCTENSESIFHGDYFFGRCAAPLRLAAACLALVLAEPPRLPIFCKNFFTISSAFMLRTICQAAWPRNRGLRIGSPGTIE